MASFSEDSLVKKLKSMDESQASIVGLSQWILFHHKQSDRIAQTLNGIITETEPNKRLPLIYLLNDVLQLARARKKFGILKSFDQYLFYTFSDTYEKLEDDATKKRLRRIVNVLTERKVLPDEILSKLNSIFSNELGSASTPSDSSVSQTKISTPPTVSADSVPSVCKIIVQNNNKISKAEAAIAVSLDKFDKEYRELFPADDEGSNNVESPITFLAELEKILKTYNNGVKKNVDYILEKRKNSIENLQELINVETKEILKANDANQIGIKYNILDKYNKIIQTKQELESLLLGTNTTDVEVNNSNKTDDNPNDASLEKSLEIPDSSQKLLGHENEFTGHAQEQEPVMEGSNLAEVNVEDDDVPQYEDSSDEDLPQDENSSDEDHVKYSETNKRHKSDSLEDTESEREAKKQKIESETIQEFSKMKTSDLLSILKMVAV